MKQFFEKIAFVCKLIKNIWLPAVFFAVGLFGLYLSKDIDYNNVMSFHVAFIISCLLGFVMALVFKHFKILLYFATLFVGYSVLNYLRIKDGVDFVMNAAYANVQLFMGLNFIWIYFLEKGKFFSKRNLLMLLVWMFLYALLEELSYHNIEIEVYSLIDGSGIGGLAKILFGFALILFFVRCCISGRILDYAFLFMLLSVVLGFYYVAYFGFANVMFCIASVILLLGYIHKQVYERYFDEKKSLKNRHFYELDVAKFKLKYSLILLKIDDYSLMNKKFGKVNKKNMLDMLTQIIVAEAGESEIYAFSKDMYLLMIKNENINFAYQIAENIRRKVASTDFMLPRFKKPAKVTITASVSEKKRSDQKEFVLLRALNELKKSQGFSQNVTLKALK